MEDGKEVSSRHQPVMLNAVLEALNVKSGGHYIDATFGRGGHAVAILERIGDSGTLLAIDKDVEAVSAAKHRFGNDSRFTILQGSFSQLGDVVKKQQVSGMIDGVLLDLGVSSPQLDDAHRGFSFRQNGPLDMRMDTSRGMSAAQWLAMASEKEIVRVLRDFGEERYARRIAQAIVSKQSSGGVSTTGELAELIGQVVPTRERSKDPATRSFQAIRIYINRELDDLCECLASILDVLASGGRLVVLSFHSLEDRIVKRFIRDNVRGQMVPRGLPLVESSRRSGQLSNVGKAQKPSAWEVKTNPRSRSAVLRVAERI